MIGRIFYGHAQFMYSTRAHVRALRRAYFRPCTLDPFLNRKFYILLELYHTTKIWFCTIRTISERLYVIPGTSINKINFYIFFLMMIIFYFLDSFLFTSTLLILIRKSIIIFIRCFCNTRNY